MAQRDQGVGMTIAEGFRWTQRLPNWLSIALLGVLLVGSWAIVYGAGGTSSAWPHLFYLPIVLATLPFGVPGGVVAAIVATLLCGPLMPLDVAMGQEQSVANWVTRGAFFIAIGAAAGGIARMLRDGYEDGLVFLFAQQLEDLVGPAEPDRDVRTRLATVLSQRQFHPVFQPIYSLDDGRLVAVEALTRFESEPYRPPHVWFEQAHQIGLGVELELAATEQALRASEELCPDIILSVNASPETLADPRLCQQLDRHRERRLIVEVTEHEVIDDYPNLIAALQRLRDRGVVLAVDDAGAGIASLRHVVALAPEFIKLDHSLTQGVRSDPVRRALAGCLVQFAHQIGAVLVVEGIEETADLRAWQQIGAHAAQGYLLAHPGHLPVDPVCDIIEKRDNGRFGLDQLLDRQYAERSS